MKAGRGDADGVPQRCGHATPWGLLNDALDGDKRSGDLFREFGQAFHGKRQLFWSREFFFGLVERTDEDIAAAPDVRCSEHVCEIGPWSWELVIAHDARFEVLQAAATDGRAGVKRLLDKLEAAGPPGRSGEYVRGRSVFLRRAA
jgi:hypothetical protein